MSGDKEVETVVKTCSNIRILLDNIRSGWNVGSIFRTADGFGIDHAYLCGITPTPEDRAVMKTDLGASKNVSWSHHRNSLELAGNLKNDGWMLLGLETIEAAAPITEIDGYVPSVKNPGIVLILGNEIAGIDPNLIELCNRIFRIPVSGMKKSINVAVAFGIAAFYLATKRSG